MMPLESTVESGMLKMDYGEKKVKPMAGIIENSSSVALFFACSSIWIIWNLEKK